MRSIAAGGIVAGAIGLGALAYLPVTSADITVQTGDENVIATVESDDGTVSYAEIYKSEEMEISWRNLPEPPRTVITGLCEIGVDTEPSAEHDMDGPHGCIAFEFDDGPGPHWTSEDVEWETTDAMSPEEIPHPWVTIHPDTLAEMVVDEPGETESFGIDIEVRVTLLNEDEDVIIAHSVSDRVYIVVTNTAAPEGEDDEMDTDDDDAADPGDSDDDTEEDDEMEDDDDAQETEQDEETEEEPNDTDDTENQADDTGESDDVGDADSGEDDTVDEESDNTTGDVNTQSNAILFGGVR